MYHCVLKFLVCSGEPCLEQAARKAVSREQFVHRVESCGALAEADLSEVDVLLADLPEGGSAALRAQMKKGAVLVLCAPPERIAALSDGDLNAADGWWETPQTERLCALRIDRMLDALKFREDCWLTHNYLDTAMDSVPDMIWFKDIKGIHLKVNEAFCHAVSKTKAEVTGKPHYDVWDIPEEEYKKGEYVCVETEDVVIEARKTCQFIEMVKTRSGMRQFRTHKSPIFDRDGEQIIGTVGVAHDVTDLANVDTELEILLQSIPFAVVIWDMSGKVINLNERFERYFGVTREDILGRDFETWRGVAISEPSVINGDGFPEVTVHVRGAHSDRVLEVREEPIYDVFHNNVGRLGIYRDVTRERALEKRLLRNMNTDFLTGLCSRRYFYECIAENRGKTPVSLLYVDLDHFKQVNDSYGHGAGDEALMRTADILRGCFPGELIARLGGDEFIVALLGEYDAPGLCAKAQALLDRIRQIFGASKRFGILSASVGIAHGKDPNIDIDVLIHQSDAALYEAKENGKSQYRVYHAK